MALGIVQWEGTFLEPPAVCRAALSAGHLISISRRAVPSYSISAGRHVCSVSTPLKPVESWSRGAVVQLDNRRQWLLLGPVQPLQRSGFDPEPSGAPRGQACIVLYD